MTDTETTFEGWAILELMGHRRLAGYVQEAVLAGGAFIRIDVPGRVLEDDGENALATGIATQFYSPGAVYCITPTTETTARAFAARAQPAPVQRWELEPRREPALVDVDHLDLDLPDDDEETF